MFPRFLPILTLQVLCVFGCVRRHNNDRNHCKGTCKVDNTPMDVTILRLDKKCEEIIQNTSLLQVNISEIKELYMNTCKLKTITKDEFKKLTNLEIFSAAQNNISEILVGTFDDNIRLKVLNFSRNIIAELNNGLFDKLPNLKTLNFEGNHIRHIGNKLFKYNLQLEELRLSDNKLTYIDGNMFEELNQILILSIDKNQWECNCSLWKFHQISLRFLGKETILPECNNKKGLKSMKFSWRNLKEADFTCLPSIQLYIIPQPKSNEIILVCKVLANPRPTSLIWYSIKNGNQYPISTKTSESVQEKYTYFNNITIKIEPKFVDMYTCVANQNQPSKISVNKSITIEEILQKDATQNGGKNQPQETTTEMLDLNYTEAMNLNKAPIDLRINLGNTANLECSSREPLKTSWYFRGLPIDEQVISRAKDKYKITQDSSKSVLSVTNIFIKDQGLYTCKNSVDNNEEIHFMLSVMEPTTVPNRLLAISLGTIFCILLIVFIITLCYFKCKNHQDIQNLNRTVNRNSTNDYVTNKNEYMVESSIYDSSDNNIYEDIIYGPAGK